MPGPIDSPPPTESPSPPPPAGSPRSATPVPTRSPGGLTPPEPEGDISLAVWANELDAWWFGDLPNGAAEYSEGTDVPFLLAWAAEPGEEYAVEITSDCSVGNVPAIDFLAGVESADAEIFEARWGPGETGPDAPVPLPGTPAVDIDNLSGRLLYLYGGRFLLLPEEPHPADGCPGELTVSFPVRADTEEMILLGSLRLADSEDHRGLGAADVATTIGLSASVDGIGEGTVELERGATVACAPGRQAAPSRRGPSSRARRAAGSGTRPPPRCARVRESM